VLFFYFREAWRSFKHHRGLAYTAVLSLTGALTLSGVFLMFTHNAEISMALVGERREMVVYLNDDVSDEDRDALMARIKLRPELLNYPAMEEASRQISEFPEVEDVRYGGEWVRRLDEIGIGLKRGAIAVGLVVALAILFVMYNTIRLTVLARRSQVLIMSRLGASDAFIAMPFVIEAVMQAALAALLALGAVFGFQQAFISQVVHVSFLPWTWALVFLGVTAALASLAAGLSLSRVIRKVGA
jgi:cell division protein FtsX